MPIKLHLAPLDFQTSLLPLSVSKIIISWREKISSRTMYPLHSVLRLDATTKKRFDRKLFNTANVYRQTTDKLMLKSVISTVR